MDQANPERPGLALPPAEAGDDDLDRLLRRVAAGDQRAFDLIYRQLARPVYGVVLRVLRDPARSEEVTQEVMVEVWRTAARFDPGQGRAVTWAVMIAHRRAVDRVRSDSAAAAREQKTAWDEAGPADQVADLVEASLDRQRVRRCLDGLTDVQRRSITLAYYGGLTYRQVADQLGATLPAVKSRMRDGLLRMRDCLGVS